MKGVVAVLAGMLLVAAGVEKESPIQSRMREAHVHLEGERTSSRDTAGRASSAAGREPYVYQRIQTVVCGAGVNPRSDSPVPCMDEGDRTITQIRTCEDGSTALDPLHRRAISAETGGYVPGSGWEQVDNGGCPEEPTPQVVLTVEEFRRLPIEVRVPMIQPFGGRALVTMGVAVHTDGSPQELDTTVVGVPVRVRATPVQFAWDYGDGSAMIRTPVAGHEWPHHAALGEYPEPGEFELRLTTTWRGEYRVDGAGPWLPVAGTASTTSDPVAISVETAPARLVSEF